MLYLRFKTKETAQEFKEKFETCQEQLGGEADRSKDSTSTWKDTSQDPEEEEDEEGGYYDDDEGESAPMFEAQARMQVKEGGRWSQEDEVLLRYNKETVHRFYIGGPQNRFLLSNTV